MGVTPIPGNTARLQVERLLQSETFRNADSQRRLLAYLTEKSLAGEADQLKEYTVGIEVFSKAPSYDPQHDASVRVQAGKLRQKLDDYYRTEGASDPVCVSFPKGRFRLAFETRTVPTPTPAPAVLGRGWKIATAALAGALLLTAVAWWSSSRHAGPAWDAALQEFWQPFLKGRPLLISVGTPLFVRHGDVFVRDPQVNDTIQGLPASLLAGLEAAYPGRPTYAAHIYTGIGEAKAVFELARLLGPHRPDLLIKGSSTLSWEDITGSDVIFLGSTKYNRQLKDMPAGQTLVMVPGAIRNLRPRPGEPEVLRGEWPSGAPYIAEDYALIARLPGLRREGEMLILAASSTEGTLAAAQYVTQPARVADLMRRLRSKAGRLPAHFEVVIHARFKTMVPVEMTYQFHHVLGE
jgi:hypothetical protein